MMLQPHIRRVALAAFATLATCAAAQAETILVMGEEIGCIWCARWTEDVGGEYDKTAEGRAAPLRRIDIHQPIPDDLTFDGRLTFSPTFVLMQDGQEVSRLEGYPGEDFFWPILQRMLDDAGVDWRADG